MLWHITKREVYDNMTSLRFSFTVILLVLLMVINAVTFMTRGYKKNIEEYRNRTAGALDRMRENCRSVYNLILNGPGDLYKEPGPLTFCADGEEENIPDRAVGRSGGWGGSWSSNGFNYSAEGFWRMNYPGFDRSLKNIMPGYLKTDWAFIIGGLISLGKFAGAFISVMLPLSIAILLNLLIINVSGAVELSAGCWGRIGVIVLISAVYVAVFVCLGIFVSTRCSKSSTSLLILLLIWVVFVVLMPSILGSISSGLKKVPSADEISQRKQTARDDLWKRYEARGLLKVAPSREKPNMVALKLWAECLNEEQQTEEKIEDENLNAQLAQIQVARQITRMSPTAIYRYALESLSSTGFERHREFIANVRAYRDRFWEYIKSEDRKDPR